MNKKCKKELRIEGVVMFEFSIVSLMSQQWSQFNNVIIQIRTEKSVFIAMNQNSAFEYYQNRMYQPQSVRSHEKARRLVSDITQLSQVRFVQPFTTRWLMTSGDMSQRSQVCRTWFFYENSHCSTYG